MNAVLLILAKTHQLEEKYISTVCTTSLSRAEIIRNQRFLPFRFVLSSLSFPFLSPVLPRPTFAAANGRIIQRGPTAHSGGGIISLRDFLPLLSLPSTIGPFPLDQISLQI